MRTSRYGLLRKISDLESVLSLKGKMEPCLTVTVFIVKHVRSNDDLFYEGGNVSLIPVGRHIFFVYVCIEMREWWKVIGPLNILIQYGNIFSQDNMPCFNACDIQEWFQKHKRLHCVGLTSKLIEHLWGFVEPTDSHFMWLTSVKRVVASILALRGTLWLVLSRLCLIG